MRIRLGYACITKTLDNITMSSTYTYTEYLKTYNLKKLQDVVVSNLKDLEKILNYNIKNNIHFFRLSSGIVPLATKEDVLFDYYDPYKIQYNKLSKMIHESNMRIDFHPDQFCVLNSTNKDVVYNSIKILDYHYNLLKYLNVKNKLLLIHIGSSTFGKKNSITRFINNFNKLPKYLKECIAIENDDKVFNIEDCLYISKKLDIPVVLDYHHHICNNTNSNINLYLNDIFNSWKNITPKFHFSSSKSKLKKEFRSHNDFIKSDDFITFIELIKKNNKDVDIMIEAKATDKALFKLIREIKYKTNYIFLDETSFIV